MVEDDCRYDPTLDGQSHSPEGRGLSRTGRQGLES